MIHSVEGLSQDTDHKVLAGTVPELLVLEAELVRIRPFAWEEMSAARIDLLTVEGKILDCTANSHKLALAIY